MLIERPDEWGQAEARLLELHQALLDRDPIATAEFCELSLRLVLVDMRARYGDGDPELLLDACSDAILGFCEHPEKWQPHRASMRAYLITLADGDIRNARKKSVTRLTRESPVNPADLRDSAASLECDIIDLDEDVDILLRRFAHLLSDPVDQQIFKLMALGERDEYEFAVLMGIENLPQLERRRRVNNIKEKIKKRFQRADIRWGNK